jgi:hypothetical protein
MWHGFCEKLKECGRDGNLFFITFQVLLLSGLFWNHGGSLFLLGFVILLALCTVVMIVGQRDRFERLGRLPPLSERDLQAARARLVRGRR